MSVESGLYSHLTADAGVSALVSTRVSPFESEQESDLPCITYFRVSSFRPSQLKSSVGLVNSRIQIDCWASSYAGVKALAEAVRQALQGYSGTWGAYTIEGVQLVQEVDSFLNSPEVYRVVMTFEIWHSESIPI